MARIESQQRQGMSNLTTTYIERFRKAEYTVLTLTDTKEEYNGKN